MLNNAISRVYESLFTGNNDNWQNSTKHELAVAFTSFIHIFHSIFNAKFLLLWRKCIVFLVNTSQQAYFDLNSKFWKRKYIYICLYLLVARVFSCWFKFAQEFAIYAWLHEHSTTRTHCEFVSVAFTVSHLVLQMENTTTSAYTHAHCQ